MLSYIYFKFKIQDSRFKILNFSISFSLYQSHCHIGILKSLLHFLTSDF